jgi:hypothetical protein
LIGHVLRWRRELELVDEKDLDKCFVKAWVMRKIWTDPMSIPVFLEISGCKLLLDGRSRGGLWGNLSELR